MKAKPVGETGFFVLEIKNKTGILKILSILSIKGMSNVRKI